MREPKGKVKLVDKSKENNNGGKEIEPSKALGEVECGGRHQTAVDISNDRANRSYLEAKVLEFKADNEELVNALNILEKEHDELLHDMDAVIGENEQFMIQVNHTRMQNAILAREREIISTERNQFMDDLERLEEKIKLLTDLIQSAKEKLTALHPQMAEDIEGILRNLLEPREVKIDDIAHSDSSKKTDATLPIHQQTTCQNKGMMANLIARIKAEGELEILGSEEDRMAMRSTKSPPPLEKIRNTDRTIRNSLTPKRKQATITNPERSAYLTPQVVIKSCRRGSNSSIEPPDPNDLVSMLLPKNQPRPRTPLELGQLVARVGRYGAKPRV